MKANEYQDAALRTANLGEGNHLSRFSNWGMGLAGESGEVVDELKKVVHHKHKLDPNKIAKELGDVLWYAAVLAKDLGYNLDEIMQMNIDKLKERYPDGFSKERSRDRES